MIKHYWLAVDYVENSNLWANQHRYTERFLNLMPNGGIRRLQRHGLKADGVHGKIDNLHIFYDGDRISTVLEDADPVTQNGSMDYPGGNREMALGYNEWGVLVSDESRGIDDIEYDRFGNPLKVSYSDGRYTENVYSATGERLKTTHRTLVVTGPPSQGRTLTVNTTPPPGGQQFPQGVEQTLYRGNVIYRDGKVEMILFPGGYATFDGGVTFHYYTQHYLGNNRAVINGSTGAVEQTTAYYPYGGIIADLGNPHGGQPYRFGGKELITANGLNEYDFGARWYYPAVPGFTKPDSMSEKYPWLSPYLYCGNDPVNRVDRDGDEWRPVITGRGDYVDFEWIESKEARDKNGKLLPYHYEQAILFTPEGKDGKTFDKETGYNIGSSTAVVYKSDGTTEEFDACTYPSDVEKFATVPEGQYEAKVGYHKNSYVALRLSDIDTENFNANSIELGNPNPAHPNTTKARGINIHLPGKNNLTGMTRSNQAVSQGCLLIDRNRWQEFIGIFNTPTQRNSKIGIIIMR